MSEANAYDYLNGSRPTPPPIQAVPKQDFIVLQEREQEKRALRFSRMFWLAVAYGIVYSFCLYNNYYGMLHGVFALATIGFCRVMEYRNNVAQKGDTLFLEVMMVLLSVSTGLTGNDAIIAMNICAVYLLVIVRLLHNYYRDDTWDLGKYFGAILIALIQTLAEMACPIQDAIAYSQTDRAGKNKNVFGIFVGVLIAVPLLAIVISLLCSADVVFHRMWNRVFDFNIGDIVLSTFVAIFGFMAAYCGLCAMNRRSISEEVTPVKTFGPAAAITTLSLTAAIYLPFSIIQITYLFVGKGTLPENYTYAEYARQGFFQLLAVVVINLILVLLVQKFFREHALLKGLLITICGCTYIMIASAVLRMLMYVDAYHLTRKRVMVLWALVTIAILMIGVVIQILKRDFPLFRYGLVVISMCYLVLSLGRMDYFIADYNLAAMHKSNEISEWEMTCTMQDYWMNSGPSDRMRSGTRYLVDLSSDAAPVIAHETGTWSDCYWDYQEELLRDDTWRQWNLSRYLARQTANAKIKE